MEKILIDSSVILRYLKSVDGILPEIMGHYDLKVSAITVSELLASSRAQNQAARSQILEFIKTKFEVVPVDEKIATRAGDLLRELDITLAHAYVAASALESDMPLLSYEIKTFDRIPDLKLVDI